MLRPCHSHLSLAILSFFCGGDDTDWVTPRQLMDYICYNDDESKRRNRLWNDWCLLGLEKRFKMEHHSTRWISDAWWLKQWWSQWVSPVILLVFLYQHNDFLMPTALLLSFFCLPVMVWSEYLLIIWEFIIYVIHNADVSHNCQQMQCVRIGKLQIKYPNHTQQPKRGYAKSCLKCAGSTSWTHSVDRAMKLIFIVPFYRPQSNVQFSEIWDAATRHKLYSVQESL